MHIVGEIPHPKFKITIFKMNHRLALKIEDEGLEQWYKFRDGIIENGVGGLIESVNTNFIKNAINIFTEMHKAKIEMLSQEEEEVIFEDIT